MEQSLEKQHVVSTPDICGGKPRVAGTRIRVADVVRWHEREGRDPEEIVAAYPQLTLSDVHAALAYYFDHRDEIKQAMAASEEFAAQMKAKLGPGPLAGKLSGQDGASAPLSS
jgi:uncharacterized protein (DUF433 family)